MFTFVYMDFISAYPEFADIAQAIVEAQADLAICEVNGYCGLPSAKQQCANWLYIAHNLQIRRRQLAPCDYDPVTEVKSKNDMEKFLLDPELGGYGLESTTYGVRLKQLLKNCRFGVGVRAMGCYSVRTQSNGYVYY